MLRILLTGFLVAAPLGVAAQDFLPNLYDVTVVETWDTLNVREAPDGKAKVIGTLRSNATGVELLGRDASGKWGRVRNGYWGGKRFTGDVNPRWSKYVEWNNAHTGTWEVRDKDTFVGQL